MKCHNCGVGNAIHEEEGCNDYAMDIADNGKLFATLIAVLREAEAHGRNVDPGKLLAFVKETARQPEYRKALKMKIRITPSVIADVIETHFAANPEHGYNCADMDVLAEKWKHVIQQAKPNGATQLRAFRYVLVTGERDY